MARMLGSRTELKHPHGMHCALCCLLQQRAHESPMTLCRESFVISRVRESGQTDPLRSDGLPPARQSVLLFPCAPVPLCGSADLCHKTKPRPHGDRYCAEPLGPDPTCIPQTPDTQQEAGPKCAPAADEQGPAAEEAGPPDWGWETDEDDLGPSGAGADDWSCDATLTAPESLRLHMLGPKTVRAPKLAHHVPVCPAKSTDGGALQPTWKGRACDIPWQ